MAAMFAGASHATLASVIFAFETTRQPMSLLPLLAGCTAAYLISCMFMRTSIMTEKIARRGARVRTEYAVDVLDQLLVRDFATRDVVALDAGDQLGEVRDWIDSTAKGARHTGYPVVEESSRLVGVLTRRDLLDPTKPKDAELRSLIQRPAQTIYDDSSLREAADRMVVAGVGRLAVVTRASPDRVVGVLTRSDLLAAHRGRLEAGRVAAPSLDIKRFLPAPMRRQTRST